MGDRGGRVCMKQERQGLLVVALPSVVLVRLPPLLGRAAFDVSSPATARLAISAISHTKYSLIVTAYPLEGIQFQEFLDEVRAYGSPCRSSGLLALALPEHLQEAGAFIGRGLNRVVCTDATDKALEEAIADLLRTAPRAAARLLVNLRTQVMQKKGSLLTQTENISSTGMLVRAPSGFRIGERIGFQFNLPDSTDEISGTGEVVRNTRETQRRVNAIGIRFIELDGNSHENLQHLLAGLEDREKQ